MQPALPAVLLALSGAALSMAGAAIALFAIGLAAAKNDIVRARGIYKIVALTPLCFAVPLAVFGAEHFATPQAMLALVPRYMPWRMFWVYFVGLALIAAALSIATRRQVRWSGMLFGVMMFLFVAMLAFPGALKSGGRIPWTIVFRELSFGGAGLVLAGAAGVGRVPIAVTAIFFGVEHFLHPLALPGVPLEKEMPAWVPLSPWIDYLTGAFLIVAGVCFLLQRNVRLAATYVGAWILLLVAAIYGPVMVAALADPSAAVQIEGLNYFADTLLFGGVILSLAAAGRK
jgi:uncharacterized membrane protein